MAEIRTGDIVEGIERERRQMQVLQIHGQMAILEFYDEGGKQNITIPLAAVRFVSDTATPEFLATRERWVNSRLNFVSTNKKVKEELAKKFSSHKKKGQR